MELQREDYAEDWRDELSTAAAGVVHVLEDIRHHEIGDAWEIGTDPEFEIDRIRRRCDELEAAICEARRGVARVQSTARLAVIRRSASGGGER